MIRTIKEHEFIDELLSDEYAGWSYNGAKALFEYLEQYEDETEQPIELDRVALRCDYSEYSSCWDAMMQYQPDDMPVIHLEQYPGIDLVELQVLQEEAANEWLLDKTIVIGFDGGVIIANF